jgi:N-acyl-D-aspartate/D-glutamate deacylase
LLTEKCRNLGLVFKQEFFLDILLPLLYIRLILKQVLIISFLSLREKGLLTLGEAVHKMTGKPARKPGLDRRGELTEGCFADVVVFDPAAIRDRATFEQPHQFAEGVHWVIADGHITLDRGMHSSRLVGRVLTPAA